MLRYVKVLPLAARRYQITVPKNLIKDTGLTTKAGPSANYNFYVNVGTVPSPAPDTVAPTLLTVGSASYRSPSSEATAVAKTSDVVLYFNEDVQIGTTTQKVKFCFNSNADASDSTPHCSADFPRRNDTYDCFMFSLGFP